MEQKLKTLKELGKNYALRLEGDKVTKTTFKNDEFYKPLKQEGIKWYKFFNKGETEICQNWNLTHARPIKEWIKYFFNLTNRDIK